ncbi:hypothetical protein LPJ66_006766 [Kickxella alabastrina]|uniref:Uncharacterized protein n=1 Tax=Kickxella alabastrina TaxID=61397 RepID=A0ACC1IAR7_9FUNG|nr:hypothetical protein LPJ66_006766 [Kickxella alabastrina]
MNRKRVTAEHPEWDLATINRELGRMWKMLPTNDRQDWEARAAASQPADEPALVSATSTPRYHASPVPLPAPSASASASAATTSMPATPASETATPAPMSAARGSDGRAAPHAGNHAIDIDVDADADIDADAGPESEAEDVEMQEDSEDEQRQPPHGALAPASGSSSAPASHSVAAAIVLPKQQHVAAGPPPTAKPAVKTNGAPHASLAAAASTLSRESLHLNRTPESQ